MNHAMIDVEALRLKQPWKAPLMEVGLVVFTDCGDIVAEISYAIEPKLLPHWAESDPDTVAWWNAPEQAEPWAILQARIRDDGVMPQVALHGLQEFMTRHNVGVVWFAGPTYDQVMLEAYYDHYEIPRPWAYNATRDFRTIRKQFPGIWDKLNDERTGRHDAISDCEFQVSVLREISDNHGVIWL